MGENKKIYKKLQLGEKCGSRADLTWGAEASKKKKKKKKK